MNWYLAKLVFRIICGEGQHTPQFDEQIRLIEAGDEAEALVKAQAAGAEGQDEFYNQQQALVQWKFIDVAELYKLSGLLDGAELYSRIQETDDADRYIELICRKAAHIRESTTHKYLQLL
jgi:hypothetical protein